MLKIKRRLKNSIFRRDILGAQDQQRKVRVRRALFYLGFILVLHTFALIFFESLSLWQAIWLTATTVTTVGYGDVSAQSFWGQLSTIVLLYGPGIALLAQLVGDYIDIRIDRKEKMFKGLWRWNVKDHILIINTPTDVGYLERLVSQFRQTPGFRHRPIQLLTDHFTDGLPDKLRKLDVIHYNGKPFSDTSYNAVNIHSAAYIILLAEDAYDPRSDSVTLDILDRIQQLNLGIHILSECVDDNNRSRLRRHGARGIIRPIRAYPSIVVRALAAPGSEELLENLFSYDGEFVHRIEMPVQGKQWMEIQSVFMRSGIGTALGYVNMEQQMVTNPPFDETVYCQALFILTRAEVDLTENQMQKMHRALT